MPRDEDPLELFNASRTSRVLEATERTFRAVAWTAGLALAVLLLGGMVVVPRIGPGDKILSGNMLLWAGTVALPLSASAFVISGIASAIQAARLLRLRRKLDKPQRRV